MSDDRPVDYTSLYVQAGLCPSCLLPAEHVFEGRRWCIPCMRAFSA